MGARRLLSGSVATYQYLLRLVVGYPEDLGVIDVIYVQELESRDLSIVHHDDEREGNEVGDDEKIGLDFSREPFGETQRLYRELLQRTRTCHLFDSLTNIDIASYAKTSVACLDGYTALVIACSCRSVSDRTLSIVFEPAQRRTVLENVDEVEEEEIDLPSCHMAEEVPLVEEVEIDLSSNK